MTLMWDSVSFERKVCVAGEGKTPPPTMVPPTGLFSSWDAAEPLYGAHGGCLFIPILEGSVSVGSFVVLDSGEIARIVSFRSTQDAVKLNMFLP